MTLTDIRICVHCGREYEWGFYGAGKKFCSQECRRHRHLYSRKPYIRKDKVCKVCGRSILKVGQRKFANKYCSKKCMNLAQRMKRCRKYCTIKIPISELPRFFRH